MARKPTRRSRARAPSPRSAAPTAAADSGEPPSAAPIDRAIDALLRRADEIGYRNVTLADVALEAGLSMAALRGLVPCKEALVAAFLRRIDQATLEGAEGVEDEPRGRLFDLLMRRFDALHPHRAGVRAILRALPFEPALAATLGPQSLLAAAWMLEAAGISASGLSGLLRVQGLAAVAAYATRAWLDDDSPDLSKTMAAADRGLDRAEQLAGFLGLARRRAPDDGAAAEPPARGPAARS